jgi:hypothetical protein
MRYVVMMLSPFLLFAEHKHVPRNLDLAPAVNDTAATRPDLSKINSSEVKKAVDFDTLLSTISEMENLLAKLRDQVTIIRNRK